MTNGERLDEIAQAAVAQGQAPGVVAAVAHGANVPVHLDGARLFNAAVALKRPASDFTRHVDSVTFCVSKGLSAPVGSVVCGVRSVQVPPPV